MKERMRQIAFTSFMSKPSLVMLAMIIGAVPG